MERESFEFDVNGVACTSDLGARRRHVLAIALVSLSAFLAAALVARPAMAASFLDWIKDPYGVTCGFLADQISALLGVFYDSSTIMNEFDQLLGDAVMVSDKTSVLQFVEDAQRIAVKPIAVSVLALALLLQLLKVAQRMDAGGPGGPMPGVREVFGLFVFCACYLYVVGHATELARGVYTLLNEIAWRFSPANGMGMNSEQMGSLLSSDISEGNIVMLLALVVAWFVTLFAVTAAVAASYGRGIEIYLLTMFTPLALAFLALDETRQWGVGFIKSYCAACLAGAIILFFMWICPYIIVGTCLTDSDFLVPIVRILAACGLMGMGVAQSGNTARQILGG